MRRGGIGIGTVRRRGATAMVAATVLALAGVACGDDGDDAEPADVTVEDTPQAGDAAGVEGEVSVTTPAFGFEEPIPERFARAGGNVSPAVTWEVDVDGAAELLLVVDDPDAPTDEPFVHWLVAGLDPATDGFGEGEVPADAVEGRNGFGDVGWGGPAPPEGETHRYFFRLFVLDAPSGLEGGFSRAGLDSVLDAHLVVSAETVGVFPA